MNYPIYTSLRYALDEMGREIGASPKSALKVLEIGCGVYSPIGDKLRNAGKRFELHGLDINSYASENKYIDKFILGNAEDIPVGDGVYDIAFSLWMLEHITDYEKFLKEMSRIVDKGSGLLVLVFPNPSSVDGMVTRLTPHWFHVFFRKNVQKMADAERHTFQTTYSFKSVRNVVNCLKKNDFSNVNVSLFSETHKRFERFAVIGYFANLFVKMVDFLGLDSLKSTVVITARKQGRALT